MQSIFENGELMKRRTVQNPERINYNNKNNNSNNYNNNNNNF